MSENATTAAPKPNGIGASVRRREDARFITGTGNYTDDINQPGQVYGAFCRSPYPRARINNIDSTEALSFEGVVAIYTGAQMVADGSLHLKMVSFDDKPWYEIDTIDDLAEAEKLFTLSSHFPRKILPISKPTFGTPIIEAITAPQKAPGVLSVAKTIQDPI